jgi:hypothetical protein
MSAQINYKGFIFLVIITFIIAPRQLGARQPIILPILTAQQACDSACAELTIPYIEGSMATLQVIPEADSVFVRWETVDGVPLASIYYAQPGETVIAIFNKK